MLFLHLFHFRLKLFHPRHRNVGFIGQREKDRLDHEGQADNGPAHVADHQVQPVQNDKDRFGEEEEPAPVNGIDELLNAQFVLIMLDRVPFLRPSKEQ